MLESLLVLLLITLLAWVILLIGLPELLTWLARRNRRQRHQLIQAVRRQENELKSLMRQLQPFSRLEAPQYRQTFEMVADLLDSVQASRRALLTMDGLRFPHLPAAVWPIRHFVSHPGDTADIVATFRRLRQLRRSVEAGNRTLVEARAHLQQLQQMPEQFRQECEAALARLGAVQAVLQKEQREGVSSLGKWRAEHGRLQQIAHGLRQGLGTTTDVPLEQADRLGRELIALEQALSQLEGSVQDRQRQRLALDKRRQAVEAALAALGEVPPPLKPATDVVQTLLAEATELRRQGAFDRAEPLLDQGEQWLELGRTFQATAGRVDRLLRLQSDSLDPMAINRVAGQLQQAQQSLANMNALAQRRPYAPLPGDVAGALAALMETLAQIQAQAAGVEAQYQREVREQEQIAKGRAHELVRAWNTLRRVLKLADSEPLTKRYHSLMEQRPAANGRPAQLRAWALQAAELQQDLLESADYLQYRLNLIGQWMNQLAAFLRELDANEAMAWGCLQPQVVEIKQGGQALQQRWKNARRTGWLDETHERLDDVKLQYQKLQQDYEVMERQLHQLNLVDDRIQETIRVIGDTAANIDPLTMNRMMELIDSHYQHAFQAASYEEAMEALRRAEEFANKLAMQ